MKFFSLLLTLMLLPSVAATGAEPPELTEFERFGGLMLNLSARQLPALPGCGKPKLGPLQEWGADGLFHQDWTYAACGLEMNMVADGPKAPQSIFSITLKAPSKLATRRGIRIGSTEQQALKAYAGDYNREESQPGQSLVFGSVYGGLIMTISKGKVSRIFLGAAAE